MRRTDKTRLAISSVAVFLCALTPTLAQPLCELTNEDPVKWRQSPDLSIFGIDVRVDSSDQIRRILADDFPCTETGPITEIHFWSSWFEDRSGEIESIRVSFWSDVPADENNPWSHPGERLWERVFGPGEFEIKLFHQMPDNEWEWFMDPYLGVATPQGDKGVHMVSLCMDPGNAFVQEGNPDKPIVYWLAIEVQLAPVTVEPLAFGWKTRDWQEEQWNDAAVFGVETGPAIAWRPLGYPEGHELVDRPIDLSFVLVGEPQPEPMHDLGDAPDRTNSFGVGMTAYPSGGPPGVGANYPTVYGAGSPPHGPIHWQPKALAWLGADVSLENEADLGPDMDGTNNIDPPSDTPDRDGKDDAVQLPLVLPHCRLTDFDFTATAASPGAQMYVNVWFDWTRDGDWDDVATCPQGGVADEWAVQNQIIVFGNTPGVLETFTTNPFLPYHANVGPSDIQPIWMRITLSEQPWDQFYGMPGEGGAGPPQGYELGETEDYYFIPEVPVEPEADLGDAPDSTNSHGVPMTAYPIGGPPGVGANYPTVYGAGSPPHGPIHRQPKALAWLGGDVSLENEADVGPDMDSTNNILPPKDVPDKDDKDDAVKVPLKLPHCQRTTFSYTATTVSAGSQMYVNVWFDWNRDGDWDDILQCADNMPVSDEWAVQNQLIVFPAAGTHTFNTPAFVPYHKNPPDPEADPIWMRITLSEQPWDQFYGMPGEGGAGPPQGYELGETEDYYFIPEVPVQPEGPFIEFSLDIGSDTELSDPFMNGNEAFDPGDVYHWKSAPVIPPGRDGFKDDMTIFGYDPLPDPPDPTLTSRVPVGLGQFDPAFVSEFFDLDGHDQLDIPLVDLINPDIIPKEPIVDLQLACVYPARFLAISFDDDTAPGWYQPLPGSVPVTSPSPAGLLYGQTANRDEVLSLFTPGLGVGPGPMFGPVGIADEVRVHQSLVPNPDNGEREDDDVDSLDIVETLEECPWWYFSPDHEAPGNHPAGFGPLDPGGIYMVSPAGGPIQVIDEAHLGVREEADIDAFEFAYLTQEDGVTAFGLLFSVDQDDPMTPADESGGLDPRVIYASDLTGRHWEHTKPLKDDVDGLMIWRRPLGRPHLLRAVSRRLHVSGGGIGQTFDIQIEPVTSAGVVAETEPRMNGQQPQEVFTFHIPIEAIDGAVNCGQEVVVVNGVCNGAAISGNELIVDMTFNLNACVKTTLSGLRGAGGGEPLAGPIQVQALAHQGNVNGDTNVNILDMQAVKLQLFQPVGPANFHLDVNVDNRINILDMQAVKLNLFQPASCP